MPTYLNSSLTQNHLKIEKSKALRAYGNCTHAHEFPTIRRQSAAKRSFAGEIAQFSAKTKTQRCGKFFLIILLSVSSNRVSVACLEFKAEMIRYKRDKFGVGRLALRCVNGVGENFCQHINIAPVPCDLDSMADSPLNAGRGGAG